MCPSRSWFWPRTTSPFSPTRSVPSQNWPTSTSTGTGWIICPTTLEIWLIWASSASGRISWDPCRTKSGLAPSFMSWMSAATGTTTASSAPANLTCRDYTQTYCNIMPFFACFSQITAPSVYHDQLEPESPLACREPGQAHAQFPDGLRRGDGRASSDVLPSSADRVPKRGKPRYQNSYLKYLIDPTAAQY